ncbi:MAG: 50S ribosomal protein L11 methyltransferase [Armatimonadetes bacterium]|nr:50S ribosomal protein L11 methyltransferase [Armatimonadota bacterium]
MATEQRWAEIAIMASGDAAQEAIGAVITEVVGIAGYAATAQTVTTYLPVDERLENTLLTLKAALTDVKRVHKIPGSSDEITVRFVAEEDWATAWKQYFKPQKIGTRIVVKPTWEAYDAEPDDVVIEIDPGMAFGTGLHATTRLCLTGLETHVFAGASVADVGTGSGILAVAAILLGAGSAVAVDNDPLAVRIAAENVSFNGVSSQVNVYEAAEPPPGQFDIVVANILAHIILALAAPLFAATKAGGVLITSGILAGASAEQVAAGLTKAGFRETQIVTEGEWASVVARA